MFRHRSQTGSQMTAVINESLIYKVSSTLANLCLERAVRAGEMRMCIDRKKRDKLLRRGQDNLLGPRFQTSPLLPVY